MCIGAESYSVFLLIMKIHIPDVHKKTDVIKECVCVYVCVFVCVYVFNKMQIVIYMTDTPWGLHQAIVFRV